jgi:acyl carrier protein
MTDQSLFQKLRDMASTRFGKDLSGVTAETDFFEALGIDSFQAMELLTEVEETFDIEIPDYELQGIRTFSALAGVIESRI